ncbi:MAG: fimbria major subunit [Muribaculaceae bacterium]|nr:fimbria major subunit [Muribaculaceae bacterium]
MQNRIISRLLHSVIVGSMLTACSVYESEYDLLPDKSAAGDYQVTFDIRQVAPTGTRANTEGEGHGELVDGEGYEHTIGVRGNYAFFFDSNKRLLVTTTLEFNDSIVNPEDNVEIRYWARFSVEEDQALPSYCMLVLNGEDLIDDLVGIENNPNATYQDVMNLVWRTANGTQGRNADGLFTMTNAVYNDAGGTDQTLAVVPVDAIRKPGDDDPDKDVMVRVERMVAKFTLEMPKANYVADEDVYRFKMTKPGQVLVFTGFEEYSDGSASPVYQPCNWAIDVTGWNLNGIERSTRLFKDISSRPTVFTDYWNSPENWRNYWAVDEHYSDQTYPWQYRKSIDVHNVPYYSSTTVENNLLLNRSFNELNLGGKKISGEKFCRYAPENTYDYDVVKNNHDGRPDLLAGTHLLVGAKLRIDHNNASKSGVGDGQFTDEDEVFTQTFYNPNLKPKENQPVDWYRDRDGFFYRSEIDCIRAKVYGFNNIMNSQRRLRFTFYNWSGKNSDYDGQVMYAHIVGDNNYVDWNFYWKENSTDTEEHPLTRKTIGDVCDEFFDVEHGDQLMARGDVKDGDGQRLPWLSRGYMFIRGHNYITNEDLKIALSYDRDGNDDIEIDQTDYDFRNDLVKSLLYEWAGAIDHYSHGLMYYPVAPVVKYADDKNGVDHDVCGVVRNNWYQFNLTGINRIGTPVDYPNDPIVPNYVELYDQLNISINIIDWHRIYTHVPSLPDDSQSGSPN